MPSARRKAIEYTPQFGGGIFRPKEVVEEERSALEEPAIAALDETSAEERVPSTPDPIPLHALEADERPAPAEPVAIERAKEQAPKQVAKQASKLASDTDSYPAETVAAMQALAPYPDAAVAVAGVVQC